jgi:hypothetical protein
MEYLALFLVLWLISASSFLGGWFLGRWQAQRDRKPRDPSSYLYD